MPEYQGSANKAHVHGFTGSSHEGRISFSAVRCTVGSASGFASIQSYGTQEPSGGSAQTVFASALKFAFTTSGSISNTGATAKPPTVAFMWILRFI